MTQPKPLAPPTGIPFSREMKMTLRYILRNHNVETSEDLGSCDWDEIVAHWERIRTHEREIVDIGRPYTRGDLEGEIERHRVYYLVERVMGVSEWWKKGEEGEVCGLGG
ncbi:hypothetical protein GLAREA_02474 [Glarea lozoyensis ATCC 20868]|uniref:Uncharacterized protein n=1 Tax=Glarea lozoyensis (strain ATCC 20868 / MF5171) TaxID=1116229 RepID=S3D3B3_GLAL2|nr:uncharacterized protein GLAREA_02474 [Glarea lozoyensis ATCC 20868]EPE26561.1 hypothetical protein GLAREA_02474 [Glarea lozoyensis ATCC 20868]